MTSGKICGLILCLALALFTGNKLRKMCVIRGWLPGARVEMKVITGKVQTPARYGSAYWIAWDNKSPAKIGDHRLNLEYDQWESLSTGDEIELIYVGKDSSAYLRNGIYASSGNFAFDLVLLALELGGAVFFGLLLWKKNRSARSAGLGL